MGVLNRDGEHGYGVCRIYDGLSDLAESKPDPGNEQHPTARRIWKNQIDRAYKVEMESNKDFWHVIGNGGKIDSIDSLIALCRAGWSEGLAKMEKAIADVEAELVKNPAAMEAIDNRRRAQWMDQGDEVCMDRLRAGDYEKAFRGYKRNRAVSMPSIRFWVSLECHGGMSGEQAFWRPAMTTVLCDALELAGWRTEILVYSHASHLHRAGGKSFHAIKLKGFSEPLDRARIVASAHTAMFHIGQFALELASGKMLNSGMGWSEMGVPEKLFNENDIAIEGIFSAQDACQNIGAIVAKLATAGGV